MAILWTRPLRGNSRHSHGTSSRDRVIYAGLGRSPRAGEVPTIVVEFVSAGKRNLMRDYEQKRDEYLAMGVREYWIVDRFARCLTVHRLNGTDKEQLILTELRDVYTTRLLPGFEFPLAKILERTDLWD